MNTQNLTTPATERAMLTSTVIAVLLRVAGPVEIGISAHALGTRERQVSLRIGDVLVYLADPEVAGRVRQRWDAALGAALRLPRRASQTWLGPRPGTYPTAISAQLTDQVQVAASSSRPIWNGANPATWRSAWTTLSGRSVTSLRGARSGTPGSSPTSGCGSEPGAGCGQHRVVHTCGATGYRRTPAARRLTGMSCLHRPSHCTWLISDNSAGLYPERAGVARSAAEAWSAALAAGRAALLTGSIRHLAIAIDDEIPQLTYSPSRDCNGHLDPTRVSHDLDDLLLDVIRGASWITDQASWSSGR